MFAAVDWTTLFAQLGSFALVSGLVGYLGKFILEHWLAFRLGEHQSALNTAAGNAMEELRSQLRVQEAKTSRLHERQASVMAGIYARLVRLELKMADLVSGGQRGGDDSWHATDAVENELARFNLYFKARRIWLDDEAGRQVGELITLMEDTVSAFRLNLGADGTVRNWEEWVAVYEQVRRGLPGAQLALEYRFRAALNGGLPSGGEFVAAADSKLVKETLPGSASP